jgi:hypothetical protein
MIRAANLPFRHDMRVTAGQAEPPNAVRRQNIAKPSVVLSSARLVVT